MPPDTPRIPYVNLAAQFAEERDELMAIFERVMSRGRYIGGDEIETFEAAFADYCGARHAVALNSGTDALILGLHALGIGPGDEVITQPNSFIASAAAIVLVGARPVFVDVLPDQNIDPNQVADAVTPRTKAIMPVHLTGRVADMEPIRAIAERHGLKIIEDAAQAVGSRYDNVPAGALGDVGCFSTHPLKNLAAAGDGGVVTTNDERIAASIRSRRNHGLVDRDTVEIFGTVSRMDTLQAAILSYRLGKLDDIIAARRRNAQLYQARLDPAKVFFPPCRAREFNTFHTFVVQLDERDAARRALDAQGIRTAVHYPIPIHLQPAARELGYGPGDFPVCESQANRILTLPVFQQLSAGDIETVADAVNAFFDI